MMTCRELVEVLFDFTAGGLSGASRERAQRHFEACPFCRSYFESYCHVIRLGRRLPQRPLPPALAQRLQVVVKHGHPPAGERAGVDE